MEIRPAEISQILKQQIASFEEEADVAEVGQVLSVGDGIADLWRQQYFGGDGVTTNDVNCAACDPDGDELPNLREYLEGTDPVSSTLFRIAGVSLEGNDARVSNATHNPAHDRSFARTA